MLLECEQYRMMVWIVGQTRDDGHVMMGGHAAIGLGMCGWSGCCGYSQSQVGACLVHPRPVDAGFDPA